MLHFLTSAPMFVVREIMALASGFAEDAAAYDTPSWAESIVHVSDRDAGPVMHALRAYRIEGRRPGRAAIADPTFVMAAQSIERNEGGSSAPAAATVR